MFGRERKNEAFVLQQSAEQMTPEGLLDVYIALEANIVEYILVISEFQEQIGLAEYPENKNELIRQQTVVQDDLTKKYALLKIYEQTMEKRKIRYHRRPELG